MAPDGQWRTDCTGVQPDGDIQAGESFSVRFIRPDLPGSLLTVTYAVQAPRSDRDYYEIGYRLDHCSDGGPDGDPWTCVRYEHGSRLSCRERNARATGGSLGLLRWPMLDVPGTSHANGSRQATCPRWIGVARESAASLLAL